MHHLPTHPHLLHPLTGLPLRAVGIVNGRAIWPIMGGDGTDADANDGDGGNDDTGDGDDSGDDDGDKPDDSANRMLIDERNGRKAAESLLAELTGKSKSEVRRLLKDPTKAREALAQGTRGDSGDSGDKVDADRIRREAEQAAAEKANARLVRAEVRALAAEGFANPADALHNLNLDDYDVNEDGELEDPAAVRKALADVLKAHPHYAKKGTAPKPDPSQGPRGGAKGDPGPGMPRLRQAYADTTN